MWQYTHEFDHSTISTLSPSSDHAFAWLTLTHLFSLRTKLSRSDGLSGI